MEDLGINDILAIFRRRRLTFTLVFIAVFAVALIVALGWSRYRANVTVQIEQPFLSGSIGAIGEGNNSGAGLADRRISLIQQRVTSIESLQAIITKLNLYPGLNKTLPPEKLTEIMRNSITLDFISSTISNPAAVQKESVEQLSAIAFVLGFEYDDPQLTKQALDAIVAAFLLEETNQRLSQTRDTSAFLTEELATLEKTIKENEAKLSEFRSKYGESGPSAMLFNQQASLNNTMALQSIESQISAASATLGSLRTQLAATPAYNTMDGKGNTLQSGPNRLRSLRAEYAVLSTRYGPQHPDVLKITEQIKALEANPASQTADKARTDADNPTYVQLNAQLASAEAQYNALVSQRASLRQQQATFTSNLAKNPLVEQQVSQLTLDIENLKERYSALKEKKLAADMREKLESSSNATLLKVINPAVVPENTSPSRKKLILAGLLAALFCATAAVILTEALSQGIRGANHLAHIIGVAPLVSIPHIHAKS